MKRSVINGLIRHAIRFLDRHRFRLPPFADWTPADWRRKGPECREIAERGLGWDITDFGRGDFERMGLLLFTIRNGTLANLTRRRGKCYAEKMLLVREDQLTPIHFHFRKTEDIINRGGGDLVVRVWNATPSEGLARSDVVLGVDGVATRVRAGGTLTLRPGQSVCLEDHVYHAFWGRRGAGPVLVGEVSVVNDDHTDNRFLEPLGRFPAIEEDEPPFRLLCNDYAAYYRPAARARRASPNRKALP
jgi:hypothetical protein